MGWATVDTESPSNTNVEDEDVARLGASGGTSLDLRASPLIVNSIRCCQLSKTSYRIKARTSSKKVWRLARIWRSNVYLASLHSNIVWKRKASKLRLSISAPRYGWPCPQ